jgi:hypothetical protein
VKRCPGQPCCAAGMLASPCEGLRRSVNAPTNPVKALAAKARVSACRAVEFLCVPCTFGVRRARIVLIVKLNRRGHTLNRSICMDASATGVTGTCLTSRHPQGRLQPSIDGRSLLRWNARSSAS